MRNALTLSMILLLIQSCGFFGSVSSNTQSQTLLPHPRLILDHNRLTSYRVHDLTRDFILPKADQISDERHNADWFSCPDEAHEAYHELEYQQRGDDLYLLAFARLMDPDNQGYEEALNLAVTKAVSWHSWGGKGGNNEIRDHGLQYMIRGAAFCFDWCYDLLPTELRNALKNKLIEQSERMFRAATEEFEMNWGNWWHSSYQQNHWSTNNSALGLAALALLDIHPRAQLWLDHSVSQLTIKQEILNQIADGSWHEGLQYQSADLLYMLPFWHAYYQNTGENLFPSQEYLEGFVLWRTYNYVPNQLQPLLEFADHVPQMRGASGWFPGIMLHYLAEQNSNGRAAWIKEALDRNTYHALNWYRSQDDSPYLIYEVLYSQGDNVVQESPNTLPTSSYFPDQGILFCRDSWQGGLNFAVRFSPYLGSGLEEWSLGRALYLDPDHEHRDSGSFVLYHDSDKLSAEISGLANYGSTGLHNSIQIFQEQAEYQGADSNGQYKSHYGSHHGQSSPVVHTQQIMGDYSYIHGDTRPRYRVETQGHETPGDHLTDSMRRAFLFFNGQNTNEESYVLCLDIIDAAENYQDLQAAWRLQLPQGVEAADLQWNSEELSYTSGNSIMSIENLYPGGLSRTLGENTTSQGLASDSEQGQYFLDWNFSLNETQRLAMLMTSPQGNTNHIMEFVGNSGSAILFKSGNRYILMNPLKENIHIDSIESNGELAIIEVQNNSASLLHHIGATKLIWNGEPLI